MTYKIICTIWILDGKELQEWHKEVGGGVIPLVCHFHPSPRKSQVTHTSGTTQPPRDRSKVYLNMSIDASYYLSNDSWKLKLVEQQVATKFNFTC